MDLKLIRSTDEKDRSRRAKEKAEALAFVVISASPRKDLDGGKYVSILIAPKISAQRKA